MVVGFLKQVFKNKDEEYRKKAEELVGEGKKPKTRRASSTKSFESFVKSEKVKGKLKEWKSKYNYKKRGMMALLYILWLNNKGSPSKVLSEAKDILSKLKGKDLFSKFLNVLKLAPEEKMD